MSAVLLAGCGGPGPVHVAGPPPQHDARAQCFELISRLPGRVAGQDKRNISTDGASAGAWGDPPIVLRCGVPRPAALHRTSACYEIDHVGWLATQHGRPVSTSSPIKGTLDFTTIGRSAYVEVSVPDAYQPQADALTDLAASIRSATRSVHPCR